MLNAFRHQRGSHSSSVASCKWCSSCSTPFGIKEDRTPQRCRPNPAPPVLNAFRHQRGSHAPRINQISRPSSAQRLSASKRIAHLHVVRVLQHVHVLNAFRHQRGSHWYLSIKALDGTPCSTPFGIKEDRTLASLGVGEDFDTGAQRLSASKRIAPLMRLLFLYSMKCSTPFGIKEDRTRLNRSDRSAGL